MLSDRQQAMDLLGCLPWWSENSTTPFAPGVAPTDRRLGVPGHGLHSRRCSYPVAAGVRRMAHVDPSFPTPGATVQWSCEGSEGGQSTQCSATRAEDGKLESHQTYYWNLIATGDDPDTDPEAIEPHPNCLDDKLCGAVYAP